SGVIAVISLPLVIGFSVTARTNVAGRDRKPGSTNSLPGRSGVRPGTVNGMRLGTSPASLSAATAVPLDSSFLAAQPVMPPVAASTAPAPTMPRKPRRLVIAPSAEDVTARSLPLDSEGDSEIKLVSLMTKQTSRGGPVATRFRIGGTTACRTPRGHGA